MSRGRSLPPPIEFLSSESVQAGFSKSKPPGREVRTGRGAAGKRKKPWSVDRPLCEARIYARMRMRMRIRKGVGFWLLI